MDRKGQGSMEYIMTYWWAIFIVIVVGVILYQMGIFSVQSNPTPGKTGFTVLRPTDWNCRSSVDELNIVMLNAAGAEISNVTFDSPSGTCTPTTVATGGTTICAIVNYDCGPVGSRFEEDLSFSFVTKGGMARSSDGTIWGPVG
ncbi:MAG: hypothetical protein JXB14_07470 [Candidatus Altiarchaeota archaeon]|nr:hypothetical protein [Candidatus Altiarchaeota archaeon]